MEKSNTRQRLNTELLTLSWLSNPRTPTLLGPMSPSIPSPHLNCLHLTATPLRLHLQEEQEYTVKGVGHQVQNQAAVSPPKSSEQMVLPHQLL